MQIPLQLSSLDIGGLGDGKRTSAMSEHCAGWEIPQWSFRNPEISLLQLDQALRQEQAEQIDNRRKWCCAGPAKGD